MDIRRAIEIARAAHAGQTDKAGQPYILHPLRVMDACPGEAQRIVAVLHDVVEDSDWTLDSLRAEGLPDDLAIALDAVTRREGEDYLDFVRRAGRNGIARAVKIADLRDNLDMTRIASPGEADRRRMARYRQALEILGALPD